MEIGWSEPGDQRVREITVTDFFARGTKRLHSTVERDDEEAELDRVWESMRQSARSATYDDVISALYRWMAVFYPGGQPVIMRDPASDGGPPSRYLTPTLDEFRRLMASGLTFVGKRVVHTQRPTSDGRPCVRRVHFDVPRPEDTGPDLESGAGAGAVDVIPPLDMRPLIIDIDADSLAGVRGCGCSDKAVCRLCWRLLRLQAMYLLHAIDDAGFGKAFAYFSGRRGVHIVVDLSPNNPETRKAVLGYLTMPRIKGTHIYWAGSKGEIVEPPVFQTMDTHPMLPELLDVLAELVAEPGVLVGAEALAEMIPGGTKSLAGSELVTTLGILAPPGSRSRASAAAAADQSTDSAAGSRSGFGISRRDAFKTWAARHAVPARHLARSILWMKPDAGVTSSAGHAVSAPCQIHPTTGYFCAILHRDMRNARYSNLARRVDEMEDQPAFFADQLALLQAAMPDVRPPAPVAWERSPSPPPLISSPPRRYQRVVRRRLE